MNIPPTDNFKYDVAFSFLYQDEATATHLNDLLKTRLRTFIYPEHQKTVAGTDGEKTFSEVFAQHSRLVAILYRPEWGSTRWTRVEQEAIRSRAVDNGYNFAIMIPMERGVTPPAWFPTYRIYVGFERFGFDATAAVLEARATELGGEPREESLPEFAKRLIDTARQKRLRHEFLISEVGVRAANAAFAAIAPELAAVQAEISEHLKVEVITESDRIIILGSQRGLSILFQRQYANTLDGSSLVIETWRGRPPRRNQASIYDTDSKKIASISGKYDFTSETEHGWKIGEDSRIFSPKATADFLLRRLLSAEIKAL